MLFEMRFDLGTLDSDERLLPFGLLVLINGSRKTAGCHITLRKISQPPLRLSQEIAAGDAINKKSRVPHVGLCFGTILLRARV